MISRTILILAALLATVAGAQPGPPYALNIGDFFACDVDGHVHIALDPLTDQDCTVGGGSAAQHFCICKSGTYLVDIDTTVLPYVELAGDTMTGDLTVNTVINAGTEINGPLVAEPGFSGVTVSGATGGTHGGLTLDGTTSNFIIGTQDGTTRFFQTWNATPGGAPVFITSGEDAFKLAISTFGSFRTMWASGFGKLAGDPIVWIDLIVGNSLNISYLGVSLLPPAERVRTNITSDFQLGAVTCGGVGSPTTVTWSGEDYDTDTMWAGGSPTRITFSTAGLYEVHVNWAIQDDAGDAVTTLLRKNGATDILPARTHTPNASLVWVEPFAAADYIEVQMYCPSGDPLETVESDYTRAQIVRLQD